jgi:putative RecB family exonuclease
MAAYRQEWGERKEAVIQFTKGDDQASLGQLAQRMLAAFAASSAATPGGRIVAVEEQLRGPVIPGLPDLLGRVDLIVDTSEELVVSDWKTSRSRWSAEQIEESAEQLLIYTELARDFAPGKRLRIEFTVLTKARDLAIERHVLAVDPVRVDRTKRVVERVFAAIEGEHFFPASSLTACPSCPFREPCRDWRG